MKSGNLKFLEPSGPLQACNGTDLPLPFLLFEYIISVTVRARHVACIGDMRNAYKSYSYGRKRRKERNRLQQDVDGRLEFFYLVT